MYENIFWKRYTRFANDKDIFVWRKRIQYINHLNGTREILIIDFNAKIFCKSKQPLYKFQVEAEGFTDFVPVSISSIL